MEPTRYHHTKPPPQDGGKMVMQAFLPNDFGHLFTLVPANV